MKTIIPRKIDPKKFVEWLRKYTLCSIRTVGDRVEAVIDAANIEPDRWVPLIAEMNDEVLEITEFTNDYYSPQTARAAINDGEETFSPVPFHDWARDQYLTAKKVTITKVNL